MPLIFLLKQVYESTARAPCDILLYHKTCFCTLLMTNLLHMDTLYPESPLQASRDSAGCFTVTVSITATTETGPRWGVCECVCVCVSQTS